MQKSSELFFVRDQNSVFGVGRANRANTDAINGLLQWVARISTRGYEQLDNDENEDVLCARLTWDSDDGSAGIDLDDCCCKFGIKRRSVNAYNVIGEKYAAR